MFCPVLRRALRPLRFLRKARFDSARTTASRGGAGAGARVDFAHRGLLLTVAVQNEVLGCQHAPSGRVRDIRALSGLRPGP